jgi:hypothetical protein
MRERKKLTAYLEELANTRANNDYITDCVRRLKKYANGDTIQLSQITPQWMDRFRQYLLNDAKLSPDIACDYLKAIRMAFHKAINDNILTKNPTASVKSLQEISGSRSHLSECWRSSKTRRHRDVWKTRRGNKRKEFRKRNHRGREPPPKKARYTKGLYGASRSV